MPSFPLLINNQFDQNLDIFSYQIPSGASASNPSTLYPTYTKVGSVPAHSQQKYTPTDSPECLEFARQSDGFPLASIVTSGSAAASAVGATNVSAGSSVTITSANEQVANAALAFYKSYKALPYSPNALQVNNIIINAQNLLQQQGLLDKWFSDNNTGFNYSNFVSVAHWADNDARAWVGTYYCYSPEAPQLSKQLVLPQTLSGGNCRVPSGRVH